MAEKETVIVDSGKERRGSSGLGIGILIALVILLILFFVSNGFGMFGASQGTGTDGSVTPAPTGTTGN